MLSNEGVELAWTQYQALLVKKLNLLTEGMRHTRLCTMRAKLYGPDWRLGLLLKHLLMRHHLGTNFANASTKTLLVENARNPSAAALFNYASMAHNNHFFFNCLVRSPFHLLIT